MIVVAAKLKAQPGKESEVEKELCKLVEYVRNEEPGTLTYLCHRGASDPSQFFFYERYMDAEALAKHSGSPRFQQVFQIVGPFLESPPIIEMYEEVAGKRS